MPGDEKGFFGRGSTREKKNAGKFTEMPLFIRARAGIAGRHTGTPRIRGLTMMYLCSGMTYISEEKFIKIYHIEGDGFWQILRNR